MGNQVIESNNCSRVTEFILLGLQDFGRMNITLFITILLLYLLCITGNSLIIMVVMMDRNLQTPMYFFLSNFSVIDIGHTTTFMPKMMVILLSKRFTICFYCCLMQSYFYYLFGVTEFFILTLISIDRYLAICQPLRYTSIMTSSICLKLALAAWLGGFSSTIYQTVMVLKLPFCSSNIIEHYYCDIGAVLKIAGGDTSLIQALGFLITVAVVLTSLFLTVVSYIFIISTIIRIPSTTGRQKAFSTCISHLIVVSILYGAVLFIYLRPTVIHSSFGIFKAVAILNMMVAPVLNPFIYTIRNNEVKKALWRALRRKELTLSKD